MFNKTDKYIALAAVCMLTFSACSSDDALSSADKEGGGKTPIELTAGITGENPSATTRNLTRTVVTTDKTNNPAQAFSAGTSLYMVMKGVDKNNASNIKYTRTIGYGQNAVTSPANSTEVKFADSYIRYWEDSYSRDTKLSIYSVCVPGYYLNGTVYSGVTANGTSGSSLSIDNSTTYNTNSWSAWPTTSTITTTNIVWPLNSVSVASQDATNFIASQDLCFSNNVSDATGVDGPLVFNDSEKKFTSGRMIFYHALTWVTFKIKKGAGFGDSFAFTTSDKNIVLTGFNTTGTFDITQGEFTSSNTTTINKLATGTVSTEDNTAGIKFVFDGLMLPGTDLNVTAANQITFTIENNEYHLKKSDLLTALTTDGTTIKTTDKGVSALDATDGTKKKMRPGVHYIFTLEVGKTKIEKLTAAVVEWETVTAEEQTPSNARITLNLLDNGTKLTNTHTAFNLYRLADNNTTGTLNDDYAAYNWETPYEKTAATLSWVDLDGTDNDHWSTDWFWPDNNSFYHFRTVAPKTVVVNPKTGAIDGDFITLTGSETTYTDVCWGAPFYATSNKLYYDPSTNGFALKKGSTIDYQISKAIGPTTNNIIMEMFHMMSDVTIKLTTTDDGSAVSLGSSATDWATVELTKIHTGGKVLMGNGLVVPNTETYTVNGTVDSSHEWKYGFVPQSLEDVVLTITTKDSSGNPTNKYIVNMKDVTTASTSYSNKLIAYPYGTDNKISWWYPNFKYTYTFKLVKTGIKNITVTLADWESIPADEQEVKIQ